LSATHSGSVSPGDRWAIHHARILRRQRKFNLINL
jgi:hypothetical protein